MKTITIDGRTLGYIIIDSVESGTYTNFYEGTYLHTYRKWFLFGEKITVEKPKLIFQIWGDIESPFRTKKGLKKLIKGEIEILDRIEEISKGELV